MSNVECCKFHDSLKFFRMLLNEGPCGFEFFWGGLPEKRTQFFLRGCDLHRNYGMVVILLSFLCNYDNLALKLHQEKRSNLDEGWIFIGRFKVGSVLGMSVAREASKKSIKIHHSFLVAKKIYKFYCSYWRKTLGKTPILLTNCQYNKKMQFSRNNLLRTVFLRIMQLKMFGF